MRHGCAVEFHTFGVRFNAQEVPVQLVGHECLGQDLISAKIGKGDSGLNGEIKGVQLNNAPELVEAASMLSRPNVADVQILLTFREPFLCGTSGKNSA